MTISRVEELTITVHSTKLRLLVKEGDGPVILFVHGWLHSAEIWAEVFNLMPNAFKLVAIDLPGHGKSAPIENGTTNLENFSSIIEAVIKKLETERFVALVGDSLGALVLLKMLERNTGFLNAKLLLSGCPFEGLPFFLSFLNFKNITSFNLKMIKRMGTLSARLIKICSFLTVSHPNKVNQALVNSILAVHPNTAASLLKEILRPADINLSNLRILSSIIISRGDSDRLITKQSSLRLSKILGAKYREINDSGHSPMIENAKQYTEALLSLVE